MSGEKLKVIVLTHGCPNRLLELLAALKTIEVAGIFVETKTSPQRSLSKNQAFDSLRRLRSDV